jgi:hypothetical protein
MQLLKAQATLLLLPQELLLPLLRAQVRGRILEAPLPGMQLVL